MTKAEKDRQRAIGLFGKPSKAFLALNQVTSTASNPGSQKTATVVIAPVKSVAKPSARTLAAIDRLIESARGLTLRLVGQVRGGKNAMGVTTAGKHYARPAFKAWRSEMDAQICAQLREYPEFLGISEPVNIRVEYIAGDKKRRDMTGILDALFHLLEYCGVIHDDSLLWVTESSRSYDKSNPGVTITFL